MKKIFPILLALTVSTAALAGNVLGTATTDVVYYSQGDPWYTAVGLSDGSVAITAVHLSSATTEITIPSVFYTSQQSGDDYIYYNVTQLGTTGVLWVELNSSNVFLTDITTLTIEEGITTIGSALCNDWTNTIPVLEILDLPSTLTTIGSAAFQNCDNLTTINCDAPTAPALVATSTGWTDHFKGYSSWNAIVSQCKVYVPNKAAKESYNQSTWSYWTAFYTNGNVLSTSVEIEQATADHYYTGSNFRFIGLEDGTVAILSYYLPEGQTTITFPSIVNATYDETSSASCDYTFRVSSVGYNCSDFWVDDNSTNVLATITSIAIEEGITSISGNFYNATALMSLWFPSTLTSIDCDYAFGGAANLTSIVCDATIPPTIGNTPFAYTIISGGICTLTVPIGSTANYNQTPWTEWTGFYEADLITETSSAAYACGAGLKGGDISFLTYIENNGGKFYDANGNPYNDVLDLLAENGINFVRLRLYNAPGTAVTYTENAASATYRTPTLPVSGRPTGGYQGTQDILNLAKRAKTHNMSICLTFHLSDFWSDAARQIVPAAWSSATTTDELAAYVYNYIYDFLEQMNEQGTPPDYVAIGNEINNGILFGYYDASNDVGRNSFGGYCGNGTFTNLKTLLNRGSAAVRTACPQAKIVLHLNNASYSKVSNYRWFFNGIKGVDYDIIGGSYYPYWTDSKPEAMAKWAKSMKTYYNKPVLIMESGYSWTQYLPSGKTGGNYQGQLQLNGSAYNEASTSGQVSFMQDLQAKVDADDNIIGYLYWDPIFIDQKVNGTWMNVGWAEKKSGSSWYVQSNSVSNTTWFDYTTGYALPILAEIASHATYNVTYNSNGANSGSVPQDDTNYASGTVVTTAFNSGLLEKTGYTFNGWNTEPNGNGTHYDAGTGTFVITSCTTLYAEWAAFTPTNTTIANSNDAITPQVNGRTIQPIDGLKIYDIVGKDVTNLNGNLPNGTYMLLLRGKTYKVMIQ